MLNLGRCRLFAETGQTTQYSIRAVDLVTQSNVIDMLGLLTLNWDQLARWQREPGCFGPDDFAKLRDSGIDVFHPSVAFEAPQAHAITRDWYLKWNQFITAYPSYFLRVDSPADLARAKASGKIGIILGMQDSNHFRDLSDVDAFYANGQRLTQITYNSHNRLGSGCMVDDTGLTEFGEQVIARMNQLGMAVDVSHSGQRTTLDTIEASTKPVLITHSNCKTLAPGVARCKTDESIKAAAAKGGVIGLTGVRHFVRAQYPVTIEHALNHFDYAVKLVGVEHVGVGSDTDLHGRDTSAALKYDIAGLNHTRRMFELTEGLIRRGYTNQQIGLMLGGNFQRALNEIWS
jgi:membrane dipeptidase